MRDLKNLKVFWYKEISKKVRRVRVYPLPRSGKPQGLTLQIFLSPLLANKIIFTRIRRVLNLTSHI